MNGASVMKELIYTGCGDKGQGCADLNTLMIHGRLIFDNVIRCSRLGLSFIGCF